MKDYKWYLATISIYRNGEWFAREEVSVCIDTYVCYKAKRSIQDELEWQSEWEAKRLLKKYAKDDATWHYDIEEVKEDK